MTGSPFVFLVFALVYAGMILGEFPRLAVDRTGIVLLGAIALVASERGDFSGVDGPTLLLLFSFMVISAQFRLSGFYTRISAWIAALPLSPRGLLGMVILVSGGLSALLTNDVICLAMTGVLGEGCLRRGLSPLPYALALACAANIGSAATLIGNPQNMLVGQMLHLSFGGYFLVALVPTLLSLGALHLVLSRMCRGQWTMDSRTSAPPENIPYHPWQARKGMLVLALTVALFLGAPFPRELVALAAAGVLLTSRTLASRTTLELVDWQLLVLFLGLFVVNDAFARAGGLAAIEEGLAVSGLSLRSLPSLTAVVTVLSNVVSNVPATMLLLPLTRDMPLAGSTLALVSTFAGNLLLVGSIANLIVAGEVGRLGVRMDWKTHARVGVPVTLASLAIALGWLLLLQQMELPPGLRL